MKNSVKNNKLKKTLPRLIITIGAFSLLVVTNLFPSYVKASPITEENLIFLINSERIKSGLNELIVDFDLSRAAKLKSRDMINRDYFEHFAFGLTPWQFMLNAGYDYVFGGEDLAMNFASSEGVVNAWMNSPTHRDNILNPNFKDIGVGVVRGAYVESGQDYVTTMATSMFGRKKSFLNRAIDTFKKIMPLS